MIYMYILFVSFAFEFLVFFLFGKEVNLELNLEASVWKMVWFCYCYIILSWVSYSWCSSFLLLLYHLITCVNILKILRLNYMFFMLLTHLPNFLLIGGSRLSFMQCKFSLMLHDIITFYWIDIFKIWITYTFCANTRANFCVNLDVFYFLIVKSIFVYNFKVQKTWNLNIL